MFSRILIVFFIISLASCASHNYGDDQYQLRMAAHGKDVMWVPTKVEMASQMLALAKVKQGDIVYDLGSGDGVIPIQAAKIYGVQSVGIEYNADLVALSQRNAVREKVQNLVKFRQGDIFKEDFSSATVVTLFLGESLNARLMPRLLKMKPGTRVVSNTFRMDSWIPDQEVRVNSNEVALLWIVPASIDGNWIFSGLPGMETVNINFLQKKQFFDGTISQISKRQINFDDGRIRGDEIEFDFVLNSKKYVFRGTVKNSEISGLLNNDPKLAVTGRVAKGK